MARRSVRVAAGALLAVVPLSVAVSVRSVRCTVAVAGLAAAESSSGESASAAPGMLHPEKPPRSGATASRAAATQA